MLSLRGVELVGKLEGKSSKPFYQSTERLLVGPSEKYRPRTQFILG